MRSSTSNFDPWRGFFRLAVGSFAIAVASVWSFVVLVDPFDTLPLSVPADRPPVASNARFAFPALARSHRFDSALFGTSTSRLLRPAVLNLLFGVRIANLSMNDATVHEQVRMMQVFLAAHPNPRLFMLGMDVRWCATGSDYQRYTGRPMPEWMYDGTRWSGYLHMLNLYAVEVAGQMFGVLTGLKRETYGRDGYTRFVPPDSAYDRNKVAANLAAAGPMVPPGLGARVGPSTDWLYPALVDLTRILDHLPTDTRVVLFFVPYHRVLLAKPDSDSGRTWAECKRRTGRIADTRPNTIAIDFMLPSAITTNNDNYWDPLHFTTQVADRLANLLAVASRGEQAEPFEVLGGR